MVVQAMAFQCGKYVKKKNRSIHKSFTCNLLLKLKKCKVIGVCIFRLWCFANFTVYHLLIQSVVQRNHLIDRKMGRNPASHLLVKVTDIFACTFFISFEISSTLAPTDLNPVEPMIRQLSPESFAKQEDRKP